MPMDRKDYPDNWEEISNHIRFVRAGGQCECDGRCGRGHEGRCQAVHGAIHPETGSYVVLTTAHLGVDRHGTPGDKSDKMDCRPENLMAMCQACHLAFDMDDHVANRKANKRQALIEASQLEMFV